jgi:nucleotide-binding universal stress UspA family protein
MRNVFGLRSRFEQAEMASLSAPTLEGDRCRSILVVVDGNEPSRRAAAYAVGLAQRQALRLVVLYVHTLGPFGATVDGIHAMRVANAEAFGDLELEMDRQARALGVDIAVVERQGSPYLETMRLAGDLCVDVVVMSAGRNFGHHFLGSPVTRIVRDARCPVTVVP